MYRIYGTNNQVYGPVDADVLRQWIADGLANAQTQAMGKADTAWWPLGTFPEFANDLPGAGGYGSVAPPPIGPPLLARLPGVAPAGDGGISSVIPYKNVPALIGYYVAVFALAGVCIPGFGAVLSIPALVLGIIGLRRAKANPQAKGKVHAWIGIIAGGLFTLWHVAMVVIMIIAMAASA